MTHRADNMKLRMTTVKYQDWSLWAKFIEKLYRLTHNGQIRTVVISDDPHRNDQLGG